MLQNYLYAHPPDLLPSPNVLSTRSVSISATLILNCQNVYIESHPDNTMLLKLARTTLRVLATIPLRFQQQLISFTFLLGWIRCSWLLYLFANKKSDSLPITPASHYSYLWLASHLFYQKPHIYFKQRKDTTNACSLALKIIVHLSTSWKQWQNWCPPTCPFIRCLLHL